MNKQPLRKRKPTKSETVVSPKEPCPHCKEGPEAYRMLFDTYKFDVDLARQIISTGHEPIELEPEDVEYAVEWSHIYEQHLEHVDIRYPGIVSHYWSPERDGTILKGTVLIDGHHRAAKAARTKQPFFVYVLTEEESRQVTLRAPDLETVLSKLQPEDDKRRNGT